MKVCQSDQAVNKFEDKKWKQRIISNLSGLRLKRDNDPRN
jgi:hypothetical protein